MTVIFKAKTPDAYYIKILAELLSNNIKVAHFEIDSTGIRLCMMDAHRTILVDVVLPSENFYTYKYKHKSDKIYIGINLSHFHQMLRTIKKKDKLQLYIDDNAPTKLAIKVIPKENNRITTSFVTIQTVQELDIDLPQITERPIIVSSSEFQKMIKDMNSIGRTIKVRSRHSKIEFKCENDKILERIVEFGEIDQSDGEYESDDDEEYNQEFSTEQFNRITKFSGLNGTLKIYPGNPLIFRSQVGSLGTISIFIKSKEQIEADKAIDADY